MIAVALALTLAASPQEDALRAARDHLQKDQLDQVLFDLEKQPFQGAQAKEAASLLSRAGKRSVEQGDPIMAIQFVQMALRSNDAEPLAHEVAARAYKAQQQFGPAEEHGDKWVALTGAKEARLFRAQLALEQGDWSLASSLAEGLRGESLPEGDRKLVELIRAQSQKELRERKVGLSTVKVLEKQIALMAQRAAKEPASSRTLEAVPAASKDVIVYGTTWCGYCKQAKAFLRSRKVPFVERDVEKEPGAAQELAGKAARAGVKLRGVPVIDVAGKLILGFSESELSRALASR